MLLLLQIKVQYLNCRTKQRKYEQATKVNWEQNY